MTRSSPWLHRPRGVHDVMRDVLLALIPGTLISIVLHGPGVAWNLALCMSTALVTEAVLLHLRGRPVQRHLGDLSGLLTAALLALSLPAWLPWWQPVLATMFALVIGKQLFGGLGYNPFNPAMLGYVVLLISVPVNMAMWPAHGGDAGTPWSYLLGQVGVDSLDGWTGATPLDTVRTGLAQQQTLTELTSGLDTTHHALLALGWLLGGAYLLWRKVIPWRTPLAVLAGMAIPALIFHLVDPDRFAGIGFHWLYGATIFGALFIATDPVSGSTTPRGRLIFGLGVGVLTWLIRTFGGYPDGFAFAILLMNIAVPLIDQYTPTRVYGTGRAAAGTRRAP
ncbi:MAG: RnfABCDGE type electron transport complex subunit D [Oceanococcaceae bacterium]